MEKTALLLRVGNRLLDAAAWLLILFLTAYGGYSLWDTAMVNRGAFVSQELLAFKPAEAGEENPTLEELQQLNPDVRAWLTIDGTHIDYPVVQGQDDMEYVNKDLYGAFSLSGSVFLASANAADFSDPYNLLFGHHMENGGMFGDVVEFLNDEFFAQHTTGTLYLPDATCPVTLFACLEVSATDAAVYDVAARRQTGTDALLERLRGQAAQYRDIGITPQARLIALSTCAEGETNGRVVLFGRLESPGGTEKGGNLTDEQR